MSMVLWSLGEFCSSKDEHGALELGWFVFVQGIKDEHGALELGWFVFVQGMKDEDGAWVNSVRPRDDG